MTGGNPGARAKCLMRKSLFSERGLMGETLLEFAALLEGSQRHPERALQFFTVSSAEAVRRVIMSNQTAIMHSLAVAQFPERPFAFRADEGRGRPDIFNHLLD